MPRWMRGIGSSRFFFNNNKDDSESRPEYRRYGKKKSANVFTKVNDLIAVLYAIILFLMCGFIVVIGTYGLIHMLGHIGIMLAVIAVLAFVYIVPLRVFRKRVRFVFRLKRRCKALGFKLKFLRGFFKGFKLNKEGFDFTVDTGKKCYCVRYYTTRKRLSHLIFIDKETLQIRTSIIRNRFKFILGFNNPKLKQIKYSFDDKMNVYNRKTQKVLLLNPVPYDCFKKDTDGAIIPIGTGEHICDYIVYSGSSFIQTLVRESQE